MYHSDIPKVKPSGHGGVVVRGCDWPKGQATDEIRAIARSKALTISYKRHAIERMAERNIIMGDVLYVLKNGFVHMEPMESTRPAYKKYAMEGLCPNGNSRTLRVIVIPEKTGTFLKIVSVMWVDEPSTRAGTLNGECDE
ncbi:DUF4258 domain-containing protein [Mesorhizobium sp. M0924]|uniref:DUF4258 domain-containing protein n=1 Tax=unclassified Mesorhizobium TaxID=325217 RepID=UPI000A04A16A|nr:MULTISPECIES: DUF4258 domain-containing protein [unclassified Mesorhizobium]